VAQLSPGEAFGRPDPSFHLAEGLHRGVPIRATELIYSRARYFMPNWASGAVRITAISRGRGFLGIFSSRVINRLDLYLRFRDLRQPHRRGPPARILIRLRGYRHHTLHWTAGNHGPLVLPYLERTPPSRRIATTPRCCDAVS